LLLPLLYKEFTCTLGAHV